MNDKTEGRAKKGPEGLVQIWLELYVKQVFYEKFKPYVEETEDLSVLRELDFRKDVSQTGGYGNEHVRDFYIVRYAYAYEYEYRKMYESLLNKLEEEQGDPGKLHITTIGCGNMIDCWGFADALGRLEKNNYKYEYEYRGIDLIDWGDLRIDRWMNDQISPDGKKGYFLPGSKGKDRKAEFIHVEEANDFLNVNMDSDIYMFANSISELGEDQLRKFCSCITTENGKDRFFLLTTLRDNKSGNLKKDLEKVKLMVEELKQRGYVTEDDFEHPVNNPDAKIYEDGQKPYMGSIAAQGEAMDFFNKLDKLFNPEKPDGNKVRVYPMLSAEYLYYLVLSFKKKES